MEIPTTIQVKAGEVFTAEGVRKRARLHADWELREALREGGVAGWSLEAAYLAVRIAGRRAWSKAAHKGGN